LFLLKEKNHFCNAIIMMLRWAIPLGCPPEQGRVGEVVEGKEKGKKCGLESIVEF
jgi:hypothetical protein